MTKPWWDPDWLADHWDRRQRKDPGCWDELLAESTVDIVGYEQRSYDTSDRGGHWLAYEAVQKREDNRWYPKSQYYIDSDLVKVVVTDKDDQIRTCYHVHWDAFDHDTVMGWPVGERKRRFRKKLRGEERGGKTDKFGIKVIFDEEN